MRRTPPPTRWPTPSHAPPTTRSSQGWWCSTAGSWRVRAVLEEPPRPVLLAVEPVPRPVELPALLPELPLPVPLGAEVVRVAIVATLPEACCDSGDIGARGAHRLGAPAAPPGHAEGPG